MFHFPEKTSCRQVVQSILLWILGDFLGFHLYLFRHPNFIAIKRVVGEREK